MFLEALLADVDVDEGRLNSAHPSVSPSTFEDEETRDGYLASVTGHPFSILLPPKGPREGTTGGGFSQSLFLRSGGEALADPAHVSHTNLDRSGVSVFFPHRTPTEDGESLSEDSPRLVSLDPSRLLPFPFSFTSDVRNDIVPVQDFRVTPRVPPPVPPHSSKCPSCHKLLSLADINHPLTYLTPLRVEYFENRIGHSLSPGNRLCIACLERLQDLLSVDLRIENRSHAFYFFHEVKKKERELRGDRLSELIARRRHQDDQRKRHTRSQFYSNSDFDDDDRIHPDDARTLEEERDDRNRKALQVTRTMFRLTGKKRKREKEREEEMEREEERSGSWSPARKRRRRSVRTCLSLDTDMLRSICSRTRTMMGTTGRGRMRRERRRQKQKKPKRKLSPSDISHW